MRNEVKALVRRINELHTQTEIIQEKVEEYLDTAENTDYPNDERIEKLQNEIDILSEVVEMLSEIEDKLGEIE